MVMVYALSTCPYCKMTKKFMDDNAVPYEHTDVDLLEGTADDPATPKGEAAARVKELSGGTSFPVIVFDDGEVIVGFNKVRLAEKLGVGGPKA